jgi:hypothetical protein
MEFKNIKTNNFGEIKKFFKSLNLIYNPYLIFDKEDTQVQNKIKNIILTNEYLESQQKYANFINYNGVCNVKNSKLEIRYVSQNMGFGLFSAQNFKQDDYIGEFCGVVTSKHNEISEHYDYNYFNDKSNIAIAPRKTGNEMQFINHSYNPNCDWLKIIGFDNKYHIIIIAVKEIKIGEQIYINYGEEYWKTRNLEPI